jgi:segregation and condensation protein B
MDAQDRSRDLRLPLPVPREALVRLVGQDCRFDDLIVDLIHELRGRPYDLVQVAGGYALRTKTRFAPAVRAAHPGWGGDDVAELTRTEAFALTAIAYLQPGHQGGDFQAGGPGDQPRRHRHAQAPRAHRGRDPRPSARGPVRLCDDEDIPGGVRACPLRDLPDLERLKSEGLRQTGQGEEDDLDRALGLAEGEQDSLEDNDAL